MNRKQHQIADGLTFGGHIRALRMGFGLARGRFLMRISGDDPFKIECLPLRLVPGTLRSKELHRAWWSGNDRGDSIVSDIIPLRGVVRIKRPISFWVDGNGKMVA